MSNFLQEIKMQFGVATSLYRIMVINITVFLVIKLLTTLLFLFQIDPVIPEIVIRYLSLPANPMQLLFQPWSIITYIFLHQEVMHILFNMLILYWTGKLFTEYLGNDKLWATFILGGAFGGLCYIAAFNLFPAFQQAASGATLIGASAGVIAVLVAIATLLPDYMVYLIIIGGVRLKYVAIVSILLYAISIPLGNAGGQIAHLGGALFGFLMVRQLKNGTDLTAWLVKLVGPSGKKTKMKVVSRTPRSSSENVFKEKQAATQELVDRILDKINKSGFDSLTKEEKEILYKASGKKDP